MNPTGIQKIQMFEERQRLPRHMASGPNSGTGGGNQSTQEINLEKAQEHRTN